MVCGKALCYQHLSPVVPINTAIRQLGNVRAPALLQ